DASQRGAEKGKSEVFHGHNLPPIASLRKQHPTRATGGVAEPSRAGPAGGAGLKNEGQII
ncbi:MAG: hypothetical protein QOF24_2068, partial [Verrucomicrobiota bacterium]